MTPTLTTLLRALGVAVVCGACVGEIGDGGGARLGPGGPKASSSGVGASSVTTRRLSLVELANSYQAILGIVPSALSTAPPDSLGSTFDRVVNAQTVSPSHLEAFSASAREAASTLLAEKRLDDVVPTCKDEILPPLVAEQVVHVLGAGLSGGPEWAVVPAKDPAVLRVQYATDVTVSYSHTFPAPGTYVIGLQMAVTDGTGQSMSVQLDGAPLEDWGALQGADTYEATVTIEAGGAHVLDYAIAGSGNFTLEISELTVAGPKDAGAGLQAEREACATAIVDVLAPLAFRRPITPDERGRLLSLIAVAEGDHAEAIKMVFEAIFANPSFLYLVEVGQPVEGAPGIFALDAYEKAARISYALCESPPDALLRQAAELGELSTEPQVSAHVRRLMDEPCGEASLRRFFSQWLWLYRVPALARDLTLFPELDAEVQAGMLAETERFIHESVYQEGASLRGLLSADHSWPDPRSAFLYGLSGVTEQERVTLPEERAGLLTQPSILAVTSVFDGTSPVKRGAYVLQQILCSELPPPPAELMVAPPPPDPEATTRERWEEHSANPACSGCHSQIDPVGFAFEDFDALGRYRTLENGLAVDARGGAPTIGYADGTLVGGAALARAVAESPEAISCFSRQWLRFALGRMDMESDGESLRVVEQALSAGSLKDALAAITATAAFSSRREEAAP